MIVRNKPKAQAAKLSAIGLLPGFTVLELLVAVAIIGVLLALLLPAVMYARESARRVTCVSQMRQLGLALQNYHTTRQRLPVAWSRVQDDDNFAYGWGAAILEELEQSTVRQQLDLRRRPSASVLDTVDDSDIQLLKCPTDITEPKFELAIENSASASSHGSSAGQRLVDSNGNGSLSLPTASYVAVFGTAEADDYLQFGITLPRTAADGAVVHDRRVRWSDLRRGLSNTLLVGERTMATVPSTWFGVDLRGEDAPCRLVGSAITRPNCETCDECEFSSRHSGTANFAWADGHVDAIDDSVDTHFYRTLAQRSATE